jgi:alkylhydroperoxidase/carboxymuconolactone decarboxylase family protein YurZ
MKSLTGLMCLSLCASTLTLAIPGSAAAEGPTRKDVQMVAPALDKYTEDRLLGDVWNRPGLSRRDRSLATLAALIGRNQTIALPQHLKLALDHGVKPTEISEIITHLAFYAGWANAIAAVAVTKDVFAERNIESDRLPGASPALLPLNEAAEADRAKRVGDQFGAIFPRRRAIHDRGPVPRPLAASRSRATRPQPGHDQRADRQRSGRAADRPYPDRDEQWPGAARDRGGHHASRLLRRMAQRVLGDAGCEGRL